MPNHLAESASPYLRQHADNPVDWYPWGAEALERSRQEDRPILLSVGYAACHWCHVMAHESFENAEVAALMNERFVNVKVDREERPDIDAIYMQAVQAMTGHGGWPMTVVLTPDGRPFFGGTYFPPEDRHGMPSFRRVLHAVSDAWQNRRDQVERSADSLRELFERQLAPLRASGQVTPQTLELAARGILARIDPVHGGFDGAPKFPQAMALDFLLRQWRHGGEPRALEAVRTSFRHMARGGLYDQIGGGFHRYSVDAVWLVPHFEKMLYDNALLARLGVHLWQATGDLEVRRVVEDTIAWLLREMTSPDGGWYATLDADSEGEEGKFYVWDAADFDRVTGADAELLRAYWGVTDGGNFEGQTILHVVSDPADVAEQLGVGVAQLAAAVARGASALRASREQRVRPARDEKLLASWNGLMLRAVALAARAFDRDDFRDAAVRNGEFLRDQLVRDGRVLRATPAGGSPIAGYLEDQAAVALGFLSLYELTFDEHWLRDADTLADAAIAWFWDEATGAFFDTATDAEPLITRPREVTDNATPSGTSLVVELLLRLGELHHDVERRRRAVWVLETLSEQLARHGAAFGNLLGAADLAVHGPVEVALVGEPGAADFEALVAEVAMRYLPSLVLAGGPPRDTSPIELLAHRGLQDGQATAYVCRNYACDAPTTEAAELGAQLELAAR